MSCTGLRGRALAECKKKPEELKEILLKKIEDFQILQAQASIVGPIIHQLVLQEVESLKKTTTLKVGSQ
tara:strand:- start:745 stop:951 length:207 start_codon:yes stop_codon:yes gene_type:complete